VVTAYFNALSRTYNESVEFCDSVNGTLPKTIFKVIEAGHRHNGIFWIAANEETRQETEEYRRKDLHVAYTYYPTNDLDLCAIVGKISENKQTILNKNKSYGAFQPTYAILIHLRGTGVRRSRPSYLD